jgi:hypothetical protein
VLDASWDDKEVALLKFDVAVAQLDRQLAVEDEEEVVGVAVGVPDELALRLGEEDLVLVVVTDDPRLPWLVEGLECGCQVDSARFGHGALLFSWKMTR